MKGFIHLICDSCNVGLRARPGEHRHVKDEARCCWCHREQPKFTMNRAFVKFRIIVTTKPAEHV